MPIISGTNNICEVFLGGVEQCEVFLGNKKVFGCSLSPTIVDINIDYTGGNYSFILDNFVSTFTDPNGDSYKKATVVSLPEIGTISYLGVPIAAGFEFNLVDIANLTFSLSGNYEIKEGYYLLDGEEVYSSSLSIGIKVSDDSIEELYSNTAKLILDFKAPGGAPVISNNSALLVGEAYSFSVGDLILGYTDPDVDLYDEVIIESLPKVGDLSFVGSSAIVGETFKVDNTPGLYFSLNNNYAVYNGVLYDFGEDLDALIADLLSKGFILISNVDGVLTFSGKSGNITLNGVGVPLSDLNFTYKVSDTSGRVSNTAVFSFTVEGDLNVKGPYVNQPATIGDVNITVDANVTTVITMEMITNQATPPYNDPENDLIDAIRADEIGINNLGKFYYNDIELVKNQVITREDIILGLFKHIGTNIDDIETDYFKMSVRDEGSQEWIS